MECVKCGNSAELLLGNLSVCKNCFSKIIEKRVVLNDLFDDHGAGDRFYAFGAKQGDDIIVAIFRLVLGFIVEMIEGGDLGRQAVAAAGAPVAVMPLNGIGDG